MVLHGNCATWLGYCLSTSLNVSRSTSARLAVDIARNCLQYDPSHGIAPLVGRCALLVELKVDKAVQLMQLHQSLAAGETNDTMLSTYNNLLLNMDASKNTVGCTSFADLTDITSVVIDPKERKRQRDRERYAKMTHEERNKRNKKQRESRQKKKAQLILNAVATDNDSIASLDTMGRTGSNDLLHKTHDYMFKQLHQENINQEVNERPSPGVDITGHNAMINVTDTSTAMVDMPQKCRIRTKRGSKLEHV
ncbi:hypothetical protein ACP70R_001944 [Stipagrostis hirtigluma subsp. patula]